MKKIRITDAQIIVSLFLIAFTAFYALAIFYPGKEKTTECKTCVGHWTQAERIEYKLRP